MLERVIENWLINVHELGYQIPFCQVLLLNGYDILHISRHGRGEHGVDIIARNSHGKLEAYQLKCGDIRLPDWRKMRGEVEELVQLPLEHPGVTEGERHVPYLVTNGEIVGDALANINRYAAAWRAKRYPRLQIIQKHKLLRMFCEAHGSFLPDALVDFRQFLELYLSDFSDRLPRERLAGLLSSLTSNPKIRSQRHAKRAVEGMVLASSCILEQYERARNFISAAEGWTVVAATIMHTVERHRLKARHYEDSLELVWSALERNLYQFQLHVTRRSNFIETDLLEADTLEVRGVRTSITLGWLALIQLVSRLAELAAIEKAAALQVIKREIRNIRIGGESDWPIIAILSLYVEKNIGTRECDSLLISWIKNVVAANVGPRPDGFPNPYWLQEKTLALHYGTLPPYEREAFAGQSYTALSALDMLVRRLCRQQVAVQWPSVSRLGFCNYVPADDGEWFLWSSTKGDFRVVHSQQPRSWSQWRDETSAVDAKSVPRLLLAHQEWLLPFALTYPHRVNRELTALLDCIYGERAELQGQGSEQVRIKH